MEQHSLIRVLVVDDDDATRTGLSAILSDAGYAATGVASFAEARAAMRATPPDLLITDIRIGDYNGLQLVLGCASEVPTIVITGFADAMLELEARRAGALYMVKPIQPVRLLEVIAEMLGRNTDSSVGSRDRIDTQRGA